MTCTVGGQIIPQLNVEEATEDSSSPSRSISSRRSKTSFSPFSSRKHQSSQQSSLQSSHEEESMRYLSPNTRDDSTASNSNRSSPACSPVLRKRSRSPTPQSPEGENMVEKSSDHSSDKSPSTPEQAVQRTYSQSLHTTRPAGKNSKKSQSWYN
ncbi:hypothetical protein QQF64_001987, partial [Cirrhinus molitorella]